MIALLYITAALFLLCCYMQLRVETSYRAFTRLNRLNTLPPLAVMSWGINHQLRWTARQWARWAAGRLVLL